MNDSYRFLYSNETSRLSGVTNASTASIIVVLTVGMAENEEKKIGSIIYRFDNGIFDGGWDMWVKKECEYVSDREECIAKQHTIIYNKNL